MVDSTYPVATATRGGTWAETWNAERRLRRAVRKQLTLGIDAHCVDAVMRQCDGGAAPRADGRRLAALHIAAQTALALGWVWEGRRKMWKAEASTFRMLGGLAAREGLSEDDVLAAAGSGVDAAIAAARTDLENGPAPWRTQVAILDQLKAEAGTFATAVTTELRRGMQSPPPRGDVKESVLLRAIDGRLSDDALGAAAAAAGLDASREHGIVLLVHPEGSSAQLEAAADDIVSAIPGAVDLGLSDELPVARRIVFPVVTHGRWIEARTTLHDIATRHGILAVAPIQAPTLARLAAMHEATLRNLSSAVRGCGYGSGIIDPACVGPACAAEGASPAPVEDWPLLALAASA
jgi:hypothetical protein